MIFLLHRIYKKSDAQKFSTAKHKRMINLSKRAAKAFNRLTFFVSERSRFNYVIAADFESCKILMRPFCLFRDHHGVWIMGDVCTIISF